jgi:lysophospholipase L1-like esterase
LRWRRIGQTVRRGSPAWLVALVVAAALFPSCSRSGDATGMDTTQAPLAAGVTIGSGDRSVVVLGDSITYQGISELEGALGSRWNVQIDGTPGYEIAQQLPSGRELAKGGPEQVIINLGTNDVTHGKDLKTSAAQMSELLAAFSTARCIHLVTINEHMGTNSSYGQRARDLNEAFHAIASTDPRISVLDDNQVFAVAQVDPEVAKPLFVDTIHPTSSGQHVLADAYASALASCPIT